MHVCLAAMSDHQPVPYYVSTTDNMQVMLDQLHKLLDISSELQMDGVKVVDIEQLEPRRWEYEAYLRRSAIRHIATASNTLQSLIKLLGKPRFAFPNYEKRYLYRYSCSFNTS